MQKHLLADCWFYHTMDLPDVGTVAGSWDLRGRFDEYVGHVPLAGKTFLDVGTASGFLSFEAEKRGADVISFDAASADVIDTFPDSSRPTLPAELEAMKNGYRLAHRLLNSQAKPVYGALASLSMHAPMCDVVLLAQILIHQRDPLWALHQAARVTRETLIIAEPSFRARTPRAMFLGHRDHRSWWLMTDSLYREWLKMLGFELQRATRAKYHCNVSGEVGKKEIWTFVARRLQQS